MQRKQGIYERYIKRGLDIICSILAIVSFGWLYAYIAIMVRIKMGKPVIFKQPRPGLINPDTGIERIFYIYKFRTMTNAKNENGDFLPDELRLTDFGKLLRSTSLDELPEVFNILKGDMSVIGPRPQLVRDLVFMTDEQRVRHTVKPGLSGLAQIMGRNSITWEEKFKLDLQYISEISVINDVKIVLLTCKKVFFHGKITDDNKETDVTDDYGDYLLKKGEVTKQKYDALQAYARLLISEKR